MLLMPEQMVADGYIDQFLVGAADGYHDMLLAA